ncbi:MAG: hypothetical protein EXR75_14960 [Myxococcales bacterium]|nr:hypothetical protein [Myxococcales bacterium]
MPSRKNSTPKRLTKRELKAERGGGSTPHEHHDEHIHCVACGAHLDAAQFTESPAAARWIYCQHKSRFASCTGCVPEAQRRLDEHDRTGKNVATAGAWH